MAGMVSGWIHIEGNIELACRCRGAGRLLSKKRILLPTEEAKRPSRMLGRPPGGSKTVFELKRQKKTRYRILKSRVSHKPKYWVRAENFGLVEWVTADTFRPFYSVYRVY